jgi:hypothetical protein
MRAACHARFAGGISAFGTAICRGTREAEQAERVSAAAIMTIAEERLGFMGSGSIANARRKWHATKQNRRKSDVSLTFPANTS